MSQIIYEFGHFNCVRTVKMMVAYNKKRAPEIASGAPDYFAVAVHSLLFRYLFTWAYMFSAA